MSAFFSNLLGGKEASASKVALPLTPEEEGAPMALGLSERSEFRIEGMTCGACVEVGGYVAFPRRAGR